VYRQLDNNFAYDVLPANITDFTIEAGEPYVSDPAPAPPLGAAYYRFGIAPDVKEVTVSLGNVSPADATDGDLLLQSDDGKWKREKLAGGDEYKFCRDKDKVKRLFLIVSDHSPKVPLLGFVEANGKKSCEEQTTLIGDVSWNETITPTSDGPTHTTVGSAHLVLEWKAPQWSALGDSSYTFTYTISNCVPASASFSGTLNSSVEHLEAAPGIGVYQHHSGAPGQDMSFSLRFGDTWMAECPQTPYSHPGVTYPGWPFPGCSTGGITGLYDSDSRTYNLNCQPAPDLLGPSYTVSGQVTGTLVPSGSSSPTP